ncbi:hypothetical protein BHM03_00061511 [Ensete ventricosum]|nr:hypothetical protein BHM03_00061511 [Ensete ventricosum]
MAAPLQSVTACGQRWHLGGVHAQAAIVHKWWSCDCPPVKAAIVVRISDAHQQWRWLPCAQAALASRDDNARKAVASHDYWWRLREEAMPARRGGDCMRKGRRP